VIPGYCLNAKREETEFGAVYDAVHTATARPCLVKVISAEGSEQGDRAAKVFLREIEVLKQIQHPSIVRLLDAGRDRSLLYFVTEHIVPLNWSKLVAGYTPATRIRIACGLMRQILGALQHAHARSFVHRDVKPSNVLLTRAGGKLWAKLADFGVAKRYTDAGLSQMTREGDVVGSLPFMAPDQFINSRDAAPACDIYSAGATLYWMLTGQEPIPLDRHPCKFLAILEEAPVPLKERLADASEQLCAIVHRALEKDPQRRFKSAGEFQFQLKSAVS
jgi:serine/threonine-protein kinase